jgi:ABC-type multidrug transport system fused ATPase/permease subunit
MKKKPLFILLFFMLMGIAMLFQGIKLTYQEKQKTSDYVSIQGLYIGSKVYSSDDDGKTYSSTYIYNVNDISYTITTDYGNQTIPEEGSKITIKYNPSNPSEAVIPGFSSKTVIIILGITFILISLIPILLTSLPSKIMPNKIYRHNNVCNEEIEEKDKLINNVITAIDVITPFSNKASVIFKLASGLIVMLFCLWLVIKGADVFSKIAFLPFLVCSMALFFGGVISTIGLFFSNKISLESIERCFNIINKVYIISFLSYWFGFLIFLDVGIVIGFISSESKIFPLLFSLIFWAVGIYIAITRLKK